MSKPTITQSQKRFQESVGQLFSQTETNSSSKCVFIKSSTDTGVIRNGGRNGARFAPQSFLSTFKKFSMTQDLKQWSFLEVEVSNQDAEEVNFHLSQIKEAERISQIFKSNPSAKICHLGGGHDHIYPLLKGISADYSNVIVINIDAHADTRTDENFHSGTPFRQFAEEFSGHFQLYQIGLHPFANSLSTLTPFNKSETQILWRRDISAESLARFFASIAAQVKPKTLVVFSIDADAMNAAEVPGVSAVNPAGLTSAELMLCWTSYSKLPLQHSPIMGIYELNPMYDTLASISMRAMGSFVFETFLEKR
jgi:formiminoglutamase